jgi:hypothetical protein
MSGFFLGLAGPRAGLGSSHLPPGRTQTEQGTVDRSSQLFHVGASPGTCSTSNIAVPWNPNPSKYFCDIVRGLVPTLRPRRRLHLSLTGRGVPSVALFCILQALSSHHGPDHSTQPRCQVPPTAPLPITVPSRSSRVPCLPQSDDPGAFPLSYNPHLAAFPVPAFGFFHLTLGLWSSIPFSQRLLFSPSPRLVASFNRRANTILWRLLVTAAVIVPPDFYQTRIIPSASLTDSDTSALP